jgi:hypothetical protein
VNEFLSACGVSRLLLSLVKRVTTMRLLAVVLATAMLVGCTLDGVKKSAPPPSASQNWPAAPQGWQQTGTMTVNGKVVPVYTEIYRGEGQSAYQRALNPDTGRIQAFTHDEVGNVVWKMDPMEPSAPGG